MKELLKTPIFIVIFPFGFLWFLLSGKTSNLSYAAFRHLFVKTNGRLNDSFSRIISTFHKPKSSDKPSLFTSGYDLDTIVKGINKQGYFELDASLNQEQVADLVHFATTTPSRCLDISKKGVHYLAEKSVFNPNDIRSPRYQFDTKDIINNRTAQEIMCDPFIVNIASRYLNCKPILDIITMWWSVPFDNKATAQAAQMFHFDMDRIKFLKFFFYLTDVHTDNGPHCYIEKSHKRLPKQLKDGRFSDKELLNYYQPEQFKEFIGKKGTILIVDTRGLHKGKPLVADNRLLFQIQFSNSLFGAPFEKMEITSLPEEHKKAFRENKRTYQLFSVS